MELREDTNRYGSNRLRRRTASTGMSEAKVTTPNPVRGDALLPAPATPTPRAMTSGTVTGPVVTAPGCQVEHTCQVFDRQRASSPPLAAITGVSLRRSAHWCGVRALTEVPGEPEHISPRREVDHNVREGKGQGDEGEDEGLEGPAVTSAEHPEGGRCTDTPCNGEDEQVLPRVEECVQVRGLLLFNEGACGLHVSFCAGSHANAWAAVAWRGGHHLGVFLSWFVCLIVCFFLWWRV